MEFLNIYSEIIKNSGFILLEGLWITLYITFLSLIIAVIIGLTIGYLNSIPTKKRTIKNNIIKLFQWIGKQYIDLIRGTPLMVQAIFFYLGLVPLVINPIFGEMKAEMAGIIVIGLNAGAYLAEIFRGGIEAIDTGQMEAARSLGLPFSKAMSKVILPQAIKNMIPAILNQFIISLKDTSLLLMIGVADLMGQGKIVYQSNYRVFETMLIVAMIYYIVIKVLTVVFRRIEVGLKV